MKKQSVASDIVLLVFLFVSKDAEEYEEYTQYLKQKHQIVEFMDVVKRYQYRKQQEYENFQKQKETQEELYQKQRIVFSQITEKRQKIIFFFDRSLFCFIR